MAMRLHWFLPEDRPMIAIKRILCPTDFSVSSRHALGHAIAIAKWYESAVTLLHVHPIMPAAAYAPGVAVMPVVLTGQEREALRTAMTQLAGELGAAHVPVETEVTEGSAATAILAKAEEMPADLLVMGTHGYTGFDRLVLGSVTEKVLRKAACPVLTVPPAVSETVPPPVLFKHIMCAVDFSDCSMSALDYAMSIAQEADARLTLVHIIEVPPALPREIHEPPALGPLNIGEYLAIAERDCLARLQEAVPQQVREYCAVDFVVTTGKAYREILRAAEERKAGLLVAGIHGRGPIDRLLFGSTAQHLVRLASCPVLTLRKG
jgi:nucleotide-binding universal stress UspA family protein